MYRCGVCDVVVPGSQRSLRKVLETGNKRYPFREKANKFPSEGRIKETDDPGGTGREIVREALVCANCYEN